jgi:hypothetical protein
MPISSLIAISNVLEEESAMIRRHLIALLFIFVLIFPAVVTATPSSPAIPPAQLGPEAIAGPPAEWHLRREITLSPATSVANYQVQVTLTTSNFNYSKVRSDGADIRFYDLNDTKLAYWIETWNTSGTSLIWVKVPTSGSSKIIMYYNNSNASADQNGDNTFDIFDDFADASVTAQKWNIPGSGWTVASGWLRKTNTTNVGDVVWKAATFTDLSAKMRLKATNVSGDTDRGFLVRRSAATTTCDNRAYLLGMGYWGHVLDLGICGGGGSCVNFASSSAYTYQVDAWYTLIMTISGSNFSVECPEKATKLTASNTELTSGYFGMCGCWSGNGAIYDIDYVFSYKYVASEPVATIGTEVEAGNGASATWKFDGGYGTSVIDDSGFGNSATLVNGPAWVDSDVYQRFETLPQTGNALSFDGIDDYMAVADTNFLKLGSGDFTINYWVYLTASGSMDIISKRPVCSPANFFDIRGGSSGMTLELCDTTGSRSVSTGPLALNQWYFISFIRKGDTTFAYVDAQWKNSTSLLGRTFNIDNTTSLLVGNGPCVNADATVFFKGKIDEIEFYRRAIDPFDLARFYYRHSLRLAGRWKFDEGSGTTVADSSGLGRNGTITGNATWADSTLGSSQSSAPTGKMLTFDGVDDQILIDMNSLKNSYGITIAAWFYLPSDFVNLGAPFYLMTNTAAPEADGFWWHIDEAANRVWLRVEDSGGEHAIDTVPATIDRNRWYHVAFVIYTNTVKMYLDGQEIYSWAVTFDWSSLNSDTLMLAIGRNYNSGYMFKGSIDQVEMYSWPLSANDIYYKANLVRQSSCPIASISPSTTSIKVGLPIVFNAAGSSDAYGQNPGIASYFWDFGDGSPIIKYGTSVTVTYDTTGYKAVRLWAIDQDGNPSIHSLGHGLIYVNITSSLLFNRLNP